MYITIFYKKNVIKYIFSQHNQRTQLQGVPPINEHLDIDMEASQGAREPGSDHWIVAGTKQSEIDDTKSSTNKYVNVPIDF
jgi:hypothetical protein